MRKKTKASGWRALAAKYCAITGVAPAPLGIGSRIEAAAAVIAPRLPLARGGVSTLDLTSVLDLWRGGAKLRRMERLADCVILPPGPADADDLARVHIAAWRETYAGLLPAGYLAAMNAKVHARRWRLQLTRARAGEVVLAAEAAGGLVGYCAGAVDDGPEAEIFTLYLLRKVQHAGLGRRLFEAAARVLAGQGAASLRLWVLNANHPARGFYERRGGQMAGERPVRGWGGQLMETAYRWEDIGKVGGKV